MSTVVEAHTNQSQIKINS